MKKEYLIERILFLLVFFLLIFIFWQYYLNNWSVIREFDQPTLSNEWESPVRVGINTNDGWEDEPYISDNGDTLYYSYYPGDLLTDSRAKDFKGDIDIYYSMAPFNESKKHSISEDVWSEGGVMFSGSDIYYMSNRNSLGINNLYKNGQKLEFSNLNKSERDPYYCMLKDEFYFSVDGVMYVHKNNKTTDLLYPINEGSENIQPFLTSDCEEMYFASNRGSGVFKIYKSRRISEDAWGDPELIASSKNGIKKPTLTVDGNKLFFVQIFRSPNGVFNSDIFYVEKK